MDLSEKQLIEAVFAGGGDMGVRMRAFDWSATDLGPVSQWPHSLRAGVRIVLEERGPEDYLVAVHVRPEEEALAEALSCGRGLPEEARARAERMQRLLDEVRRRASSAAGIGSQQE